MFYFKKPIPHQHDLGGIESIEKGFIFVGFNG